MKKTPRLIHLAGYAPPQGGSFVPLMVGTLTRARAEGWRVEAVFPRRAQERSWISLFSAADIPVHFSDEGEARERARMIVELLDKDPTETILHTHFSTYDVAAVTAKRRRPGVKVVWHTHTVLPHRPLGIARTTVKNLAFGRSVDRVLCPASNIADGMAHRLAPKARIEVFPNPIDASRFPLLDDVERARRRRKLDLPEDATVLLLFGRHWEIKGGDTYMEAVRRIVDREPDRYIALVHAGKGAAVAAAERFEVTPILRDVETRDDVQDLLGAADVLLAPSRGEGMPFTVVESLCTGTPVVASRLPGHSFLPDGHRACEVVDRDPDAFADATLDLLGRGRAEITADCELTRRWIVDNLGLEAATGKLMREYDALLGQSLD